MWSWAALKPLAGKMYKVAHVVSVQRSSGKTSMPAFSWMLFCHHLAFLLIRPHAGAEDPATTAEEAAETLRNSEKVLLISCLILFSS